MTAGFTELLTKQVPLTGTETELGALFGESTGKIRLSIPDAATSSVWLGKRGVSTSDDEYKKGTQTQLPTTSLRGWYAVTDGASVTVTITMATGGVDAPDWITAGTVGASSGGSGGGGTVNQGTGDVANPWATQGVNAGVAERLATQADQTSGAQKTRITDGANDAVVMNSAPTGTEYGIGIRAIGDTATTNAINSQADGHSVSIGSTGDTDTALTVIGRLKKAVALLAGGLPSALGAGGGLKVDGSGTPLSVNGTVTANAGTGNFAGTNATGSQADGHSVSIGATTDTISASTVIGRLQNLLSRIPSALGGSGGFKTEGVGTAGTPAGGVLSIQGVINGTFVPITPYSSVHNSGSGVLSPPANALPFTQVSVFCRDNGANVRAAECRIVDPVGVSPGIYTRAVDAQKQTAKTAAGTPAASLVIRNGSGWLHSIFVSNQTATACYITIYDTIAAPSHGGSAAARKVIGRYIAAKAGDIPFNFSEDHKGRWFATGITAVVEMAENDATVNVSGAPTLNIDAEFVPGT